jgi:hypothetical protein
MCFDEDERKYLEAYQQSKAKARGILGEERLISHGRKRILLGKDTLGGVERREPPNATAEDKVDGFWEKWEAMSGGESDENMNICRKSGTVIAKC